MTKESWNYWRLLSVHGRQTWHFEYFDNAQKIEATDTQYWQSDKGRKVLSEMMNDFVFDKSVNANSADLVYRKQAINKNLKTLSAAEMPDFKGHSSFIEKVAQQTFKAIHYYQSLIAEDGHMPGDYGGPLFLLPGMVIIAHVTSYALPLPHKALIKQYMKNMQNTDGGWGMHIEGESGMYGTCLQYISLRLLGEDANETYMQKASKWILDNGGATMIPSWGKFYLSTLGVYEWDGCNSLFPEIWITPTWLPIHPSRYWCHARMVYLPMAYCYGHKIVGPIAPLIEAIRNEIYTEKYEQIDWKKARNSCSPKDLYRKASPVLKIMNFVTNSYEKFYSKKLRKKALDFILSYIDGEDEQTNYIDIGPVNQVINSLSVWHGHGKDSIQYKKHIDRWFDYLWVAEDGMKMQGYNGSQLWDTAFTANAFMESDLYKQFIPSLQQLYHYIDKSQIRTSIPRDRAFFRHEDFGGWPFSTVEHGWPITDCTGDGVKASIKLNQIFEQENCIDTIQVSKERLIDAVKLLLSFQSADGGWASYEVRRAPEWIEVLNPSEVYGEIMVDYSFVECTSSTIQALHSFTKKYADSYPVEIKNAIAGGIDFIKTIQKEDGSWYGNWGVCFTYASWFAHEALACVDEYYDNSSTVKKACDFLVSKQQNDGGWGESYRSCVDVKYVQHEQSQIINTGWALLALMISKYPHQEVIEKGIQLLLSRQEASGDFPQEGISGVFNKSCMITYTAYRNVFPIWALQRYLKTYKSI